LLRHAGKSHLIERFGGGHAAGKMSEPWPNSGVGVQRANMKGSVAMAVAHRGFGYWATIVLALIMAIFGLPIMAGGVWLITLGGSWYYAFAGLGLLVSAWFLFRHSVAGVWVYLLTFVGTVIWALWEAGLDGWAQVPRLVAPTIILI